MKSSELTILLILVSLKLFAQEFPDNFKVGNSLEIFSNDSIKIHYNCQGSIVDSICADYVRIGKIDTVNCNVTGRFKDYYVGGGIAMDGCMENDQLNGLCTYYFPNSRIRETGKYSADLRQGIWKCFYSDGKLELILNFVDGKPLVESFYSKRGKVKVKNGAGRYTGYFNLVGSCEPYKCSGKVVDGRMEGKWSYYLPVSGHLIGDEYYKYGKFIKSSQRFIVEVENPVITIQGSVPNENFYIYENHFLGCQSYNAFLRVEYKNKKIQDVFYRELTEYMDVIRNMHLQNQWILVSLTVNANDSIRNINIYSSKNDHKTESLIGSIISKNLACWKSAELDHTKLQTDIFFSLIIDNDAAIIPAKTIYDLLISKRPRLKLK